MTVNDTTIQILGLIVTIIFGGAGVGGLITALKTKKEIKKSKEEEKIQRAEAAQIIEDTAAAQVIRVREEAERVAAELKKERLEAEKWEGECSILRKEVNEMKCRLDNDMEACRREIRDLKGQVEILKAKNAKLIAATDKLIDQIRSLNHVPVCIPEVVIGNGE